MAVPVAPCATAHELSSLADCVVCVYEPEAFLAIGEWYQDFAQLSDLDVIRLLEQSAVELAQAG